MKQVTTQGIVLVRTDFGEADRIITFITPDQGKIKTIAKGVRRAKAKLAGSVEPFGVSDLSFIVGRGEINTLTSARLIRNYGNIVKDLGRTNTAYDFMKIINKATQEQPEEDYFHLLDKSLAALDDYDISVELSDLWFKIQLLKLTGHSPNLRTDEAGKKLAESKKYNFDFDKMNFVPKSNGEFNSDHIKFLRIGFGPSLPQTLIRIQNIQQLVKDIREFIENVLTTYIRV